MCAGGPCCKAHLAIFYWVRVFVTPHVRDRLTPDALEDWLAGQEVRLARLPAVVADLGSRLQVVLLHVVRDGAWHYDKEDCIESNRIEWSTCRRNV